MPTSTPASSPLCDRLRELAQIFGRLGCLGFGGPQAHIAMQNDEAVVRRQWLTQEQFSDGLAICEMLPGPASTQMGIYLGYIRAGQLGALVAGLAFIAPALVIVVALSWAYFRFQALPQLDALFFGIAPVMIAIILGFCWKLGKKSIRDWPGVAIAIAVGLAVGWGRLNPLVAFLWAGGVGLVLYRPRRSADTPQALGVPLMLTTLPLTTPSTDVLALSSFWGWERLREYGWPLVTLFVKTGTFIFGGGLVIIPLLEYEVVDHLQWLTRSEFINGIAIGQLSPGPVVLTAAFIGFKVAGVLGALVASIGVFAPSFLFIMAGAPVLLRIRQNAWVQAFLKAVRPAVVGAIAAASLPLMQTAILAQADAGLTAIAAAIGLLALVALLRFQVPTWQLVLGGGGLGWLTGFVFRSYFA